MHFNRKIRLKIGKYVRLSSFEQFCVCKCSYFIFVFMRIKGETFAGKFAT